MATTRILIRVLEGQKERSDPTLSRSGSLPRLTRRGGAAVVGDPVRLWRRQRRHKDGELNVGENRENGGKTENH